MSPGPKSRLRCQRQRHTLQAEAVLLHRDSHRQRERIGECARVAPSGTSNQGLNRACASWEILPSDGVLDQMQQPSGNLGKRARPRTTYYRITALQHCRTHDTREKQAVTGRQSAAPRACVPRPRPLTK